MSGIQQFENLGHRILGRLGLCRHQIYKRPAPTPLLDAGTANSAIAQAIEKGVPCLISRLGTPESNGILNQLDLRFTRHSSAAVRLFARMQGRHRDWAARTRELLQDNVGFFPPTDECLERFAPFYATCISQMDMVGYWGIVPGEAFLIRKYAPRAVAFDPSALEPYFFDPPWSEALEGRKVLVIHPFAESIRRQYHRRQLLFEDARVLPSFELRTIPAVQSLAGTPTPFSTWFEALAWMEAEMDKCDYEVVLIGAGGYGLPLCAHAKRRGKVAIHTGGSTQILFGIRGKRWDGMPEFARFFNDAWVRPLPGEGIPEGAKVEGGCYW